MRARLEARAWKGMVADLAARLTPDAIEQADARSDARRSRSARGGVEQGNVLDMADGLDDELAALRVRAYGVDADIHHDMVAVARLRELEKWAHTRAVVTPPPPPPTPPHPHPHGESTAARVPALAREPATEPELSAAIAPESRLRHRLPIVAAGLVVATALVVAPLTLWIAGLADRPAAVLHVSDEEPLDMFGMGERGAQRYEDFAGFAITVADVADFDGLCISVMSAERTEPVFLAGNCAPHGFSVITDLTIGVDTPQEARDALPGVTGLRFVYETGSDVVAVYAVRAAASAAASRSSLPEGPISNTSPSITRMGTPLTT